MAGLASICLRNARYPGRSGPKERVGVDAKLGEVAGPGPDLAFRNAADQMRLHILRLRLGGVVDVAADVEVVVVGVDDL